MGALHQLLELPHTAVDVNSQIGVNIVVVGDGIGRTCPTLHDSRMLARYSVGRVVCLGGMADNTRVPHMADAHRGKIVEHISRQVGKLATAVFGNRAVLFARKVTIAEKPCQYLINNNFIHQLMINSQ